MVLVSVNGNHHRIPHTGNVIIENDVAIGANCCVDRGTIESTIVGAFSKLDNLIQVAHNVIIGKGCVIAGQVGLAGSCELGNFVTIGGQSGIIGHLKVGDKCVVATNTLVTKSLKTGSFVSGIPARDHMKRRKQEAVINQLPQLQKRVRTLEKNNENKTLMSNKFNHYNNQCTIKKTVSISGIGLHTGVESTATFKPAAANSGIRFKRLDLENCPEIIADIEHVIDISRGTTIGQNGFRIHTVEHIYWQQ